MQTEPHGKALPNQSDQPFARASAPAVSPKLILGPWSVLRHRDYALLFWGQLISASGTQMQLVAVAWQVLLLTHSPIALGLIGLAQGVPRLLFSRVGGVFADVFDRRRLLVVVNSLLACASATLA